MLSRWIEKHFFSKPYSSRQLLRLLRWYPPIFFQRIVPLSLSEDFLTVHIKIRRSILTRNLNGAIYGGTLLSAVDMWYGTLLWQKCLHEGIPLEVWVERLEMQFLKAARGDVYATFSITPGQWAEIKHFLMTEGKGRYSFSFELYSSEGEMCAAGSQVLYLRNLQLRPRRYDN